MDVAQFPSIAGHPALDFVNTGAGHDSGAANCLPDYDHLLRWSEGVGLLSAAQVALLAEAHHPWLTEDAWAEAMDLRRALDAIFRAIAHGKPTPERDVTAFNAVLAAALAHRRLAATSDGGLAWEWGEYADRLELAAWTIALSAAELLTDPIRRAQVKVCGNHACDWLFLDESPSGRRRWCRMNVCGNAAKVRRFREKQKRT